MQRFNVWWCSVMVTGVIALSAATGLAQSANTLKVLSSLAKKAAASEKAGSMTVVGKDGWLFFAPELRHLTVGPFWGSYAVKVSRADDPKYADPLPAILDFKQQLDRAGIQLLLVPVPAKATIYPDEISDDVVVHPGKAPDRIDIYDEQFYQILRDHGVRVLDLTPLFLSKRSEGLYCKHDTHWSGRACEIAAQAIVDAVKGSPWLKGVPHETYVTRREVVPISGDLVGNLTGLPTETIPLTMVLKKHDGELEPVPDWRSSPVLLLGDSYNLVFHVGEDMYARGAGLADQLALRFGFPMDVVAVRGSGATPCRINLMRRRDNLAGKKIVVWVFTVREFTEGQGWRKVPVIRTLEK